MKTTKLANVFFPLSFAIVIIAVWSYFSSINTFYTWIFPSPKDILRVFLTHSDLLLTHSWATIVETITGLTLSILLGVTLALVMERWHFIQKTLYPFLIVSQTIPIISLAPVFILWFGYGMSAKIFIVSLVCFFPITMNLYDGFRQINVEHLRLFKSMNASYLQTFWLLKIPSALPSFFSGLKLAVSYSIMAAVIGEWLGGTHGLGIYMTRATKSYQTAHVFAIVMIISVFSLLLYGIVVLIERLMLRYQFTRLQEYIDSAPGIK